MKGRRRNIEVKEKHRLVASHSSPNGGWAHNPGMCSDWVWNRLLFALWDDAQPTKPHQSGPGVFFSIDCTAYPKTGLESNLFLDLCHFLIKTKSRTISV